MARKRFLRNNKAKFDPSAGVFENGKPIMSKNKSYFGMGGNLAKDVMELWVLKTRLDHGDKKKLRQQQNDFLRDCNYDLFKFEVKMMTSAFIEEKKIVSTL